MSTDSQTTGALSGALTLDVASDELGYPSTLPVRRLICRGRLAATRLGESDDWRIAASAIGAFVSSGAKDFTMPDLGDDGWFLDRVEYRGAEMFLAAMYAAMEKAAPTPERVSALVMAKYHPRKLSDLSGSLMVEEAVQVNPPTAVPKVPSAFANADQFARYSSWGDIFLVSRLRFFARQTIGLKALAKPIEQLYESPDAYFAIRNAALQKLRTAQISTSTIINAVILEKDFSVTVGLRFPYSQLISGDGSSIAALAF